MTESLRRITLSEAQAIIGQFPTGYEHLGWPTGGDVITLTNASEEFGYRIPLDHPELEVFATEHDVIVFRLPVGHSKRAPGAHEFSFDGIGWGDETRYTHGTPAFRGKAVEMHAVDQLKLAEDFAQTLPDGVREMALASISQGVGSASMSITNAETRAKMLARGDDNELRLAIHCNPFIGFHAPNAEFDWPARVIVGPPWALEKQQVAHPGMSLEDIGRHLLIEAFRTQS